MAEMNEEASSVSRRLLGGVVRVGLLGFGGGPALIPITEREFVDRGRVLDEDTFNTHAIIASMTPGAMPVKLASLAGVTKTNPLVTILAALLVAVPGVAGSVAVLALVESLGASAITLLEYASVGIAAVIVMLIAAYILELLRRSRVSKPVVVAIMLVSFLATGSSQFIAFLGSCLGVDWRVSLPSLSAVQLIVVALVAIGVYSWLVPAPADRILVAPTALQRPRLVIGIGAGVAIVGLVLGAASGWQGLRFELLVALSVLSGFGGGQAYIAFADGFFVQGGLISATDFYTQVIPITNAFPGPSMIKIAASVGYHVGAASGGVVAGTLLATATLLLVVGLCVVIVVTALVGYNALVHSTLVHNLGRFILPVICGLLLTASCSMLQTSVGVGVGIGIPKWAVAWGSLALVVLASLFQSRWRIADIWLVALTGIGTCGVGVLVTHL